jgi:hypothetical protein
MTEPARILGEPIDEVDSVGRHAPHVGEHLGLYGAEKVDDDPEGVFEPTEYALAAMARKTLRRAGIYEPTAKQIADAREGARIEYAAQAQHAIRTGKVLS